MIKKSDTTKTSSKTKLKKEPKSKPAPKEKAKAGNKQDIIKSKPHIQTKIKNVTETEEDLDVIVDDVVEIVASADKRNLKKGEYIAAIGRRKTSTAHIRLFSGGKHTVITVNGKSLEEYFKTPELQKTVRQPFQKIKYPDAFEISAIVHGGGISGQAQAVRHSIARALIEYDSATRPQLKKFGYLKRDPRSKERKKPGLKKARKAPQWSKR